MLNTKTFRYNVILQAISNILKRKSNLITYFSDITVTEYTFLYLLIT